MTDQELDQLVDQMTESILAAIRLQKILATAQQIEPALAASAVHTAILSELLLAVRGFGRNVERIAQAQEQLVRDQPSTA